MDTVKLSLEYSCYPTWVCREGETVFDDMIVSELQSNEEVYQLLDELDDEFHALFINTPHEFAYVGFPDEASRAAFADKAELVYRLVKEALAGKYHVINGIDVSEL